MRWMNLEPIIQSEVSQKEKDKYMLTYIYGIQRDGTAANGILLTNSNGETDVENGLVDTVG